MPSAPSLHIRSGPYHFIIVMSILTLSLEIAQEISIDMAGHHRLAKM